MLIAEAAASLPDGIGFGQVSERDFYVAFDPEDGDETLLTCTLYMAKVVALASITPDAGSDVDLTAALREVSVIRGLLEQLSKIETCHSRIDKDVASARTLSADLKSDIVAALRPPRFHPLQLKNFTGGAVVAPLPLPFAPCRPPARARRGRNAVVREQRRGVTPANCR